MQKSIEHIQSVFMWIGILLLLYLAIVDAKPRQALEKIENGNAPQSVKNNYKDCEEILNDIDRVGLWNYVANGKRDKPKTLQQEAQELQDDFQQTEQEAIKKVGSKRKVKRIIIAPINTQPAPQQRKKWNPFKKNKNK